MRSSELRARFGVRESRYEKIFRVSQFSILDISRTLKNLQNLKVDVHTIEISLRDLRTTP